MKARTALLRQDLRLICNDQEGEAILDNEVEGVPLDRVHKLVGVRWAPLQQLYCDAVKVSFIIRLYGFRKHSRAACHEAVD